MKRLKIFFLLLTSLVALATETHSETTNQWGDAVFGARLSIAVTNSIIPAGSKVILNCVTKIFSTNTVCFVRTEWHGMYEVVLIDDSGNSIELNDPANAGDSMETMGGVRPDESFEISIPLLFDKKIKLGHYRLVAKQRVFLIKNFDRKNAIRGELVSNPLDVQVK
jgi:hypothetical protein